jgi:hypothetical protein
VTSANLSTQTSRFIQRKTIPALGEEGVHKGLGKIFREHGELRDIEISVGGPLIVVLRQAPKIALADGLLRRGPIRGNQRAYRRRKHANPYRGPKLSKDLRIHGNEVEAGIHPFVKCLDGALGERDGRRIKVTLAQQP